MGGCLLARGGGGHATPLEQVCTPQKNALLDLPQFIYNDEPQPADTSQGIGSRYPKEKQVLHFNQSNAPSDDLEVHLLRVWFQE